MSTQRQGRLRLFLWMAGAAVLWERLWRRSWPAAAAAAVFGAMALLDILPRLPAWIHLSVLIVFASVPVFLLARALIRLRGVNRATAERRLERDSDLPHRPLGALDDTLALGTGDPLAETLWRRHLAHAADAVHQLRVRLPAPGVARRDPHGLRAAALLLLVIGLAAGHGDAGQRLERTFAPRFHTASPLPVKVDAWITPPAYTGLAPVFLKRDHGATPVPVAAGSTLVVQTSGTQGTPRLILSGQARDFAPLDPEGVAGAFKIETVVGTGTRLAVETDQGRLAEWPLRIIPDTAPEISFAGPPKASRHGHLRLAYEAHDDYGIVSVNLVIRPDSPALGRESELRLPVAMPGGKKGALTRVVRDLTAHAWAGLLVRLHLEAADGGGGTGNSKILTMVLPERVFTHPVARDIIEQRRRLSNPTPATRADVIAALDTIARARERYAHDSVVFLALSVATARLALQRSLTAAVSVRKLLWDTALRLEDGDLSIAERELRRARQRLSEALRENADADEIEGLMDDVQRALDAYLAALSRQAERRGMVQQSDVVSGADLHQLLDQARALARTGSLDQARQLLAELQRFLDSIRTGGNADVTIQDLSRARDLMNEIGKLRDDQQRLLERSFQRQRTDRDGDRLRTEQWAEMQRDVRDQEALRQRLGDAIMRADDLLGTVPQSLGRAERSMKAASDALALGDGRSALTAQGEALQNLRGAASDVASAAARKLGGRSGLFTGNPGESRGRDPFGRPGAGPADGISGSVVIPDAMGLRRATEILRELRRRAGERSRPGQELNYIDRLLRRF
jgi:uncharacterized protein (TIGR02302 family)